MADAKGKSALTVSERLAPLAHFPLMYGPTPFHEMTGLRQAIESLGHSSPRLFIKRDDCTGLAGGGNKTRKLEYLIGDALAQDCDTIVTAGALQSNHARQTAAAAAKAGLRCRLLLFDTVAYDGPLYRQSGNRLLDDILGAEVQVEPADADGAAVFDKVIADLTAEGAKPYIVPIGGSNAIGSLGYARAAEEISQQARAADVEVDWLVHASSSLGTQAGLLVGAGLSQGKTPKVLGINVYRSNAETMAEDLLTLAHQVASLLDGQPPRAEDVRLDNRFLGAGYGVPTDAMVDAVELVARTEGVLLDPVYSGKAAAGLIARICAGEFSADETIVFVHTGGMPGLFAYQDEFSRRT